MSDEEEHPRECANCIHYMSEGDWGYGRCEFRLPPWIRALASGLKREVSSDDTCSFHEPRDG